MRDLVILFVQVIGTFRRQDPIVGEISGFLGLGEFTKKSKPYWLATEWFGLEIWKRVLSSLI